jgi:hypothetical protein
VRGLARLQRPAGIAAAGLGFGEGDRQRDGVVLVSGSPGHGRHALGERCCANP